VRWSLLPTARPTSVSQEDLARRGPDFLEKDLRERVAAGPGEAEIKAPSAASAHYAARLTMPNGTDSHLSTKTLTAVCAT